MLERCQIYRLRYSREISHKDGENLEKTLLRKLFSKRRLNEQAHEVYYLIVERARDLRFYEAPIGVEDKVEGRFELILLHLFLADRVMSKDESTMALRRAVRELLVKDIDRSLREMGIGDMSISKQMKKVGEALIGRPVSLDAALQKQDNSGKQCAIKKVLDRNMDFGPANGSDHLAEYVMDQVAWGDKTAATDWSLQAGLFK